MWKVETEAINLKNHREKFLPLQNKEETKEIKVSTTESELTFIDQEINLSSLTFVRE